MHRSDQKVLVRLPLKSGRTLEQVINAAGVRYSCIIDKDGTEIASTETLNERRMLEHYHEQLHVR